MGLKIIDQTKGIWKKTTYSTLLYLLLVVILACLISSYLLGAVFCKVVFGISFFSSSQQVFDPSNQNLIEALKAMQLFNAIGTFVFFTSMTLVILAQIFFVQRQIKSTKS